VRVGPAEAGAQQLVQDLERQVLRERDRANDARAVDELGPEDVRAAIGHSRRVSQTRARRLRHLLFALRLPQAVRTIDPVSEPIVRRDELEAAIEARKELDADMEPALIDGFVERIERRLAERSTDSERALKSKREHQKEMVLGAMGVSVPLLLIAAIFTGLAGVIVVCAALAVIALVSAR
jgi:hypothetical protein